MAGRRSTADARPGVNEIVAATFAAAVGDIRRFGALRPKPLAGPPPCATAQIIPAGDPRNPTGTDVHFANQLHEAVDLAAAAGDCVFAVERVICSYFRPL